MLQEFGQPIVEGSFEWAISRGFEGGVAGGQPAVGASQVPEKRTAAGWPPASLDRGGVTFPERGMRPIIGAVSAEEDRDAPQDERDREAAYARARARRELRQISAAALPREAVATCGRHAGSDPGYTVDDQRYVAVRRGQHGAFFGNVVTCGSVWHCPVCAAKIAQERRRMVSSAISEHMAAGGMSVMLTLTSRHSRSDDVKALRIAQAKRWRGLRSGRKAKDLDTACGMIGGLRVFEVTHGESGWHPHFHILLFFQNTTLDRIWHYCETLISWWLESSARDGNAAERAAQHWDIA
ncbi:MAG: protein rep, partial [Alphaproteobacteria bacterium]|nr:protein rep [Alphaproteobacteria bacterium]